VPAQNPGDRCSRFTAQTTTFLHLRAKVRCRSPDSGAWYHVAAVRPSVFAGTILDRLIRSSWAATWGSGRAPRLGRVAIGACMVSNRPAVARLVRAYQLPEENGAYHARLMARPPMRHVAARMHGC